MKFQVIELADPKRYEKKNNVLLKLFWLRYFFLLSSKPDKCLLDGEKTLAYPHLSLVQC